MRRVCIVLPACIAIALAGPAAAASRAQKAGAARKPEKPVLAKPIEPMPPREEKPRGGWNGAYGGLNGGGGFSDRKN